eukprot:4825878-Amphidinium_carterae.1
MSAALPLEVGGPAPAELEEAASECGGKASSIKTNTTWNHVSEEGDANVQRMSHAICELQQQLMQLMEKKDIRQQELIKQNNFLQLQNMQLMQQQQMTVPAQHVFGPWEQSSASPPARRSRNNKAP